jgi:hypothetical protein
MSQGLRAMLANRKFAIPLIILLAFCLIGLLLIGIVLISGMASGKKAVAQTTPTVAATPTAALVTFTPVPTKAPTSRPSPTLVPVGTAVGSAGGGATPAATSGATAVSTKTGVGAATAVPTTAPTSAQGTGAQATAAPQAENEQLAQTGVGWGLVLASGIGLALLVIAVRRLRLAS